MAANCKKAFAEQRRQEVLARCALAFSANPADPELAMLLAKTELDRGHARQALDWAKRALAIDERQADAYVFVGGAEQAAGHQAAARSAYRRYLELAPKGRYASDLRAIVGSP
jgi:Flp pilus assembly protein TadD